MKIKPKKQEQLLSILEEQEPTNIGLDFINYFKKEISRLKKDKNNLANNAHIYANQSHIEAIKSQILKINTEK